MSPLYEFRCEAGHATTDLRRYEDRDAPLVCKCGQPTERRFPLTHAVPDGVYSYAPNLGSAQAFERKEAIIRKEIPG